MNDEAEFRLRMTRNKNGINEVKLVQVSRCNLSRTVPKMIWKLDS